MLCRKIGMFLIFQLALEDPQNRLTEKQYHPNKPKLRPSLESGT